MFNIGQIRQKKGSNKMTIEQKVEILEDRIKKLEAEIKDCQKEYKNTNDKLFLKFIEWKRRDIEEIRGLLIETLLKK